MATGISDARNGTALSPEAASRRLQQLLARALICPWKASFHTRRSFPRNRRGRRTAITISVSPRFISQKSPSCIVLKSAIPTHRPLSWVLRRRPPPFRRRLHCSPSASTNQFWVMILIWPLANESEIPNATLARVFCFNASDKGLHVARLSKCFS